MKTVRKTYAVRGLIEWQMTLDVAGALLRINFTGGSMGTNGVRPARFTTTNPALQKLIEKSRHFSEGKVYQIAMSEFAGMEMDEREEIGNQIEINSITTNREMYEGSGSGNNQECGGSERPDFDTINGC